MSMLSSQNLNALYIIQKGKNKLILNITRVISLNFLMAFSVVTCSYNTIKYF